MGVDISRTLTAIAVEIEAMPPYRQMLLIEGHGKNRLTPGSGGSYSRIFNTCEWGVYPDGSFDPGDMHHEEGHRADFSIGNGKSYAHSSADWNQAVAKELRRRPITPGMIFEKDSSLYKGSAQLNSLLSAPHYQPDDYALEAFAEMSCHHVSLYRDHHGDERTFDGILSAEYPDLWPVFRDQAIPAMKDRADVLNAVRWSETQDYIRLSSAFHDHAGTNFDNDQCEAEASAFAIEGMLPGKIKSLKAGIRDYELVPVFVEKARMLSQKNKTDFDENAARNAARQRAHSNTIQAALLDIDIRRGIHDDLILNYVRLFDLRQRKKLEFGVTADPSPSGLIQGTRDYAILLLTQARGVSLLAHEIRRLGGEIKTNVRESVTMSYNPHSLRLWA